MRAPKSALLRASIFLISALVFSSFGFAPDDPLPSWNDGMARKAITDFIDDVTNPKSPNFVPVPERIAVFDNDGTLWAEQPMYFELAFALDQLHLDPATALAGGEHTLGYIMAASHAGMTTDEFQVTVKHWFQSARQPRFKRPFTDRVYQPMLELMAFLRAYDFKTYIVSDGGVEFTRAVADQIYGIPPEQVIGSMGKLKYEIRDGQPVLAKVPEVDLVDEGEGKPIAIQKHIGRRPIAAFGNSDGDQQMLEWTAAGSAGGCPCSFITRTAIASGRTTALRTSADWIRRSMRRMPRVGRSWT